MERKWYIQYKKADFNRLARKFNIDPVTARLIRNRGAVTDADFEKYLFGGIRDLYSPMSMEGVPEAVEILRKKIKDRKPIRVIGDYDIDGVCAAFIMKEMLTKAGAVADVDIPHRMTDGYGISKRLISKAKKEGIDTIITCDNGIAAREALLFAKEEDFTVIVTDHHEVPFIRDEDEISYILPEADAVVDPKRETCSYPYKELCGAAVAFKVGQALLEELKTEGRSELYRELLCFCAFATVGDIMELTDENRIIVKEGLRLFADIKNAGMRALLSVNQLELDKLNTYQIGFVAGPCVNAAGRLESAMSAYALFNETDKNEALKKALHLKALNERRKEITQEGLAQAVAFAEEEKEAPIIFLYLKDIHESVAGIIAGKLKELYNKPAFVLTDSGGLLKGAGRSIEAYSMFERLQECGSLFEKFGGHKMAAGFSLLPENFEKAKKFLISHCALEPEDFIQKVYVDFQMPPSYITRELIEETELLAPFGNGNPPPLFAERNLKVEGFRRIGENKNVIAVEFSQNGKRIKGVSFRDADDLFTELKSNDTLTLAYRPQLNEYLGTVSVQLVVEYFDIRTQLGSNNN